MGAVAILPTRRAIADAWDDYCALVQAMEHDSALRQSQDHNIAILRAHKRWTELFLAADRAS